MRGHQILDYLQALRASSKSVAAAEAVSAALFAEGDAVDCLAMSADAAATGGRQALAAELWQVRLHDVCIKGIWITPLKRESHAMNILLKTKKTKLKLFSNKKKYLPPLRKLRPTSKYPFKNHL
jgi:hypothetical protein